MNRRLCGPRAIAVFAALADIRTASAPRLSALNRTKVARTRRHVQKRTASRIA